MELLSAAYRAFEVSALAGEALNFESVYEWFLESPEVVLHLDRHVWEPLERPLADDLGIAATEAVCRVGVAALKVWDAVVKSKTTERARTSRPVLIVDDEWLEGRANATPPHLYVCLAKEEISFAPVLWESVEASGTGWTWLDELVHGLDVNRVDGSDEEAGGCWLVSVSRS